MVSPNISSAACFKNRLSFNKLEHMTESILRFKILKCIIRFKNPFYFRKLQHRVDTGKNGILVFKCPMMIQNPTCTPRSLVAKKNHLDLDFSNFGGTFAGVR